MLIGENINLPWFLAKYLKTKGVGPVALQGGPFVTKIARYYELLTQKNISQIEGVKGTLMDAKYLRTSKIIIPMLNHLMVGI